MSHRSGQGENASLSRVQVPKVLCHEAGKWDGGRRSHIVAPLSWQLRQIYAARGLRTRIILGRLQLKTYPYAMLWLGRSCKQAQSPALAASYLACQTYLILSLEYNLYLHMFPRKNNQPQHGKSLLYAWDFATPSPFYMTLHNLLAFGTCTSSMTSAPAARQRTAYCVGWPARLPGIPQATWDCHLDACTDTLPWWLPSRSAHE